MFSQTGPGGVGSVANNEIWLVAEGNAYTDAGFTLGTNNQNIQQWNDISGNNNHAVQGTANFRPRLETAQANGFATVVFDGSDDRILSSGVATSNETTIFTVVKFNALTNNNDGIIQASPSGAAFSATVTDKSIGLWINTSNGNIWGRGIQSNNTQRNLPQNVALTTGQFYILSQDFDGTNISQFVDGALAGSISYNGTIKDWTEFGIARQGAESLNGELAEIIVFTNSVNDAQRIIIDNYLAAKYNISLDANDLYVHDNIGNGNFDFEVAGIGRINAANSHTNAKGSGILRISNPSGLNNNEFLFWGHNNGVQQATEIADVPAGVQGRFDREWRFSEVNTSGSPVDVGNLDIAWDLSGLGSVTAADLRLLIDTDNDGVFADETPISGAVSSGGDVYEFAGVTGIANNTRLTLGTANLNQTPLPIELISFEVTQMKNAVQLNWTTATEINNDFFTIERSNDAQQWSALKEISGAGNSTKPMNYQATDENPLYGLSYYRLKQTDFDGQHQYSAVKSVFFVNDNTGNLKVYPNPASDRISFYPYFALQKATISNACGQVIAQALQPELLDISAIPEGVYNLRLERFDGHVEMVRMVVKR